MRLAGLFVPEKNDDRTCCTGYYKLCFCCTIEDVDDVISKQGYNLVISIQGPPPRWKNRH